jgi:TonB family protein
MMKKSDLRILMVGFLSLFSFVAISSCGTRCHEGLSKSLAVDNSTLPDTSEIIQYDKAPEVIYQEQPDYPRAARVNGVTGTVWLKALVNATGKVDSVIVAKESGVEGAGFEKAAIKAAYKTKWKPAIADEKLISVWVTYKIEFFL